MGSDASGTGGERDVVMRSSRWAGAHASAWLLAVAIGACTYEINPDLCAETDHCDDDEVCGVDNRCHPCTESFCPAHERCEEDSECDDDHLCANDGVCRLKCVVDAQCPFSGQCNDRTCAAPIGAPCLDFETSCVGDCIDTDNQLETVPAYCSASCWDGGCPEGTECVKSNCRKVSDGLVCQHPSATKSCGACLWDNCNSRLSKCCEGQICQDVLTTVQGCDNSNDWSDCLPLANSAGFEATSMELLDCLQLFCDDNQCLPAQ